MFCLHIYMCTWYVYSWHSQRPELPGTGVSDGCKPPCECWELNRVFCESSTLLTHWVVSLVSHMYINETWEGIIRSLISCSQVAPILALTIHCIKHEHSPCASGQLVISSNSQLDLSLFLLLLFCFFQTLRVLLNQVLSARWYFSNLRSDPF